MLAGLFGIIKLTLYAVCRMNHAEAVLRKITCNHRNDTATCNAQRTQRSYASEEYRSILSEVYVVSTSR